MAVGSTRPLTEMSTRNICWRGGGGGRCRSVRLTTLPPSCADCLEIPGASASWNLRACPGTAACFIYNYRKRRSYSLVIVTSHSKCRHSGLYVLATHFLIKQSLQESRLNACCSRAPAQLHVRHCNTCLPQQRPLGHISPSYIAAGAHSAAVGCCRRRCLGRRRDIKETGENYKVRSFKICTLRQILLSWLNEEERDGWGLWHV
jgi:hypothetical protein